VPLENKVYLLGLGFRVLSCFLLSISGYIETAFSMIHFELGLTVDTNIPVIFSYTALLLLHIPDGFTHCHTAWHHLRQFPYPFGQHRTPC
jgi:hypothetical protein